MTSELVLITGATGHLGFKTLLDTLEAGYRARVAVRSAAKEKTILENPAFKAINASDKVSFVIVPDLAAPGAYNEAVKGVDYVIHVASPITTGSQMTQEEYVKFFIEPATQGTVGMLKSASRVSGIKRIVITSSVVAIKEFGLWGQDNGYVTKAEDRISIDQGPYQNEFQAYSASKAAALNATEKWLHENKHSFDVVHIHPAFIEGRDDLVREAKAAFAGTNAVVLGVAAGLPRSRPLPGATVHNEDVARMHVESLKTAKIPAGSYIAMWNPEGTTDGTHWEDINAIVERNFPKQVKSGFLKLGVTQQSLATRFDSKKSEETFGFKFQNFESQVKSVVGHYVELANEA